MTGSQTTSNRIMVLLVASQNTTAPNSGYLFVMSIDVSSSDSIKLRENVSLCFTYLVVIVTVKQLLLRQINKNTTKLLSL